jgi:hypothetical protein
MRTVYHRALLGIASLLFPSSIVFAQAPAAMPPAQNGLANSGMGDAQFSISLLTVFYPHPREDHPNLMLEDRSSNGEFPVNAEDNEARNV